MINNNLTVHKMNALDLNEVLPIEHLSSLSPWSKDMFYEEMLNPLSHCYIIRIKNVCHQPLIGYLCFRNVNDESDLLNICVHPEYRNLGIGKYLLQYYIDDGIKNGIKTFYLDVNVSNESALHLYRSFSYIPCGLRKAFYQGIHDALLMIKKI